MKSSAVLALLLFPFAAGADVPMGNNWPPEPAPPPPSDSPAYALVVLFVGALAARELHRVTGPK